MMMPGRASRWIALSCNGFLEETRSGVIDIVAAYKVDRLPDEKGNISGSGLPAIKLT